MFIDCMFLTAYTNPNPNHIPNQSVVHLKENLVKCERERDGEGMEAYRTIY